MVVVLDSEYVYKGIMELLAKWRRHGWRTAYGVRRVGKWVTEICGSKFYGNERGQGKNCRRTGYRHTWECTGTTKRMRWPRRDARCTHTTSRGCLRGCVWSLCG